MPLGSRSAILISMSVPLTPREKEVLRSLAEGHTNREVGELLFISVRTVEMHRANILRKLRASTRADLVRYARAEKALGD